MAGSTMPDAAAGPATPAPAAGAPAPVTAEEGSAVVEFLALTLVLLLPVLYLVLVLGRVQAATFAAEGAAREAARSYVRADDALLGQQRALASVGLALRDQGFDEVDPAAALSLSCSSRPCLAPGSDVATSVTVDVALPFVPPLVQSVVPLSVPVVGHHVAAVDTFRASS
ncbi:pilus assembly protein [Cellulomonas sp. NS3]|uniref:pilus assembly protein n=1 Tax=Cellulomonas sp. NS3 TaxID=2973977 RepID=UPI002163C72B|nr:pilus assembly protein [Cellulomonas sp. NS3]